MKLAFLAPCFALLFGACTMARPEGAYEGAEPPDPKPTDEPDADDDDDDEPEPIVDARVIPRRDSSTPKPTADAGQVTRQDGEVTPPASGDPREALAGRYLMRMDMYSTLNTTSTPRISLSNRVSNLFMLELAFDGERLVGTEYLCDQTYAHRCLSGCRDWSTKVDQSVRQSYFAGERSIEREYTFDKASQKLTAAEKAIALGYDEGEGQNTVPSDVSDPRLWKAAAGPGIYTSFNAVAAITVSCQVSTVQSFTTSFSGTLSGNPVSLDGKEFPFTAKTMGGVIGQPTGTPRTQCTRERFEMQPNPQGEKFVVRFKAFAGEGCPASFDREFAASPAFM
jgi:hypothetical protein